jgi:hypothetical protein
MSSSDVLAARLSAIGFEPGPPEHLQRRAQTVDAGVCADAGCDRCESRGLSYHPFHQDGNYRAVAVCARCGHAQEF